LKQTLYVSFLQIMLNIGHSQDENRLVPSTRVFRLQFWFCVIMRNG
jgi:hypothetical protein